MVMQKNKEKQANIKRLPEPIKKVSNLYSIKINISDKNKIEEEKNFDQINLFQKAIDSISENDYIQKIVVKKTEVGERINLLSRKK